MAQAWGKTHSARSEPSNGTRIESNMGFPFKRRNF
jgi:hypothetical protein